MRLAELSERSGVPVPTIKYYLRERLLPPGRRVTATQAEYGPEHLRRLRLVRALLQVGRVPVAAAREVLAVAEDGDLDQHGKLGVALGALPQERPEVAEDDPAVVSATRVVTELTEALGWPPPGPAHPAAALHTLIAAVASLIRLGYPCELRHLLPYGRLAAELATHDLDVLEEYASATERLEAAVALTVLHEPVLLSLRRLGHGVESARRFGEG